MQNLGIRNKASAISLGQRNKHASRSQRAKLPICARHMTLSTI